ncbi:MAG: hypothetical protein QM692_15155 [Thermomicrobiales bacterium]
MDGARFDNATRALSDDTSRRSVFGLLLGGAVGLAGLAEAAAKGKKKKKGKGKKKKKSGVCAKAESLCKGNCTVGQACCSSLDCDNCRNLYCSSTPGTPGTCGCDGTDEMYKGRCGTKPVCIPAGTIRQMDDVRCCSGSEIIDNTSPENGKCLPGTLSCLSDADCTGGDCRGYQCYGFELGCPQF